MSRRNGGRLEKRAQQVDQCGGATVQMSADRQDSAVLSVVLSRLHRAAVSRRQRRRSARRSRGKTRIQMEVERSLTCSLWGYRQAAFVGIQLSLTHEWVQQWCTPFFRQRHFFLRAEFWNSCQYFNGDEIIVPDVPNRWWLVCQVCVTQTFCRLLIVAH